MMDPTAMAAMGSAQPSGPEDAAAARPLQMQQLSMPRLAHNARVVENVRGLMSIVAGSIAGILGATGVIQVRLICPDHVCVDGWGGVELFRSRKAKVMDVAMG